MSATRVVSAPVALARIATPPTRPITNGPPRTPSRPSASAHRIVTAARQREQMLRVEVSALQRRARAHDDDERGPQRGTAHADDSLEQDEHARRDDCRGHRGSEPDGAEAAGGDDAQGPVEPVDQRLLVIEEVAVGEGVEVEPLPDRRVQRGITVQRLGERTRTRSDGGGEARPGGDREALHASTNAFGSRRARIQPPYGDVQRLLRSRDDRARLRRHPDLERPRAARRRPLLAGRAALPRLRGRRGRQRLDRRHGRAPARDAARGRGARAAREPRLRRRGQRRDRARPRGLRRAGQQRHGARPGLARRARRGTRRRPERRARPRASCGCCESRECSTAPGTSSPGTARRGGAATASRTTAATTSRGSSPARAPARRSIAAVHSRRSAASTSASSPTSRTPTGACAPSSRAGPAGGCPAAVAYHLGGATSRRMGDLETELIARNTLALVLKSFPAWRLTLWAPLILGYQAWVLAQALRRGSWRAVLRGWSAAARGLPGTLRARAEVRRRTREPRALEGGGDGADRAAVGRADVRGCAGERQRRLGRRKVRTAAAATNVMSTTQEGVEVTLVAAREHECRLDSPGAHRDDTRGGAAVRTRLLTSCR